MVKKAKWLKNVKKAFSPDLKKLKHQSIECEDGVISYPVLIATSRSYHPPQFEVRVDEVNHEENTNLCSTSSDPVSATDEEEDVPADSSPSSPESVHQTIADRFPGMSEEEVAAILIQATFRGYLARREARAIRGLARLNLYMEGSVVKRQAANTLRCMQTLAHLQSEIRSRRIMMSEENQARHKQLLQKHAKEGLKNGGNWNFSNQSKEQVDASLLHKYEATMRRERGLAYAFTHQQNLKSNSKTANPMFMDPSNPTWGWSWLERWMAGGPWETSEKEQNNNNENSSVKNSTNRNNSNGGETAKSSNRNKLNSSTQPKTPSPSSSSPATTRKPRKNKPIPSSTKSKTSDEEDAKNSERNRRPSTAEDAKSSERNRRPSSAEDAKSSERNHRPRPSSARSSVSSDDERLDSSTTRRSNRVPTGSARGKLKSQSSSSSGVAVTTTDVVVPEKAPAKKRLSHTASPAPKPRRSSAPPKVETGILKAERMAMP